MRFTSILLSLSLASCATAGSDDDGTPDARTNFPDARSFPDATPLPDARPPVPDAPSTPDGGGGGLFCEEHNECGTGQCCLATLCVNGSIDPVFGACIPG